jgi:hypothetical protein
LFCPDCPLHSDINQPSWPVKEEVERRERELVPFVKAASNIALQLDPGKYVFGVKRVSTTFQPLNGLLIWDLRRKSG